MCVFNPAEYIFSVIKEVWLQENYKKGYKFLHKYLFEMTTFIED